MIPALWSTRKESWTFPRVSGDDPYQKFGKEFMGETGAKKQGCIAALFLFANKSLVFENLGDLLETLGNIDFLGALSLALQAVDAGGSHTLILDGVLIGVLGALEVAVNKVCIVSGKYGRYVYAHRTSIGAVMAGGARNGRYAVQNIDDLGNDLLLLFIKRFEILHIACVVEHLFKIGHTA